MGLGLGGPVWFLRVRHGHKLLACAYPNAQRWLIQGILRWRPPRPPPSPHPRRGFDPQLALRHDEHGNVVAKHLAVSLIPHGHVTLAPQLVSELCLDHRKRGFHVAPLVVLGQKFVAVERVVVEGEKWCLRVAVMIRLRSRKQVTFLDGACTVQQSNYATPVFIVSDPFSRLFPPLFPSPRLQRTGRLTVCRVFYLHRRRGAQLARSTGAKER
jgi:hypothetical protein